MGRFSRDHNIESKRKRLTSDTLKGYWDITRQELAFPSVKDIRPEAISEIWSYCFIIEADSSTKSTDYKYLYLGEKIIEVYGQDLTGMKVDSLICPQVDHLESEYEKVIATGEVIEDESILDINSKHIRYRQILLPLGDEGTNINAILGGMSYKITD